MTIQMQTDERPVPATADDALLSEHVVMQVTGLSRTTLREMIRKGRFPAPLQVGEMRSTGRPGRIAWLKSEVDNYIRELVRTSRVSWAPAPGAQADA